MTHREAFRLLAGASGLTGQTGASGQTGLTGEFRLWLFLVMLCNYGKPSELCTQKGRHVTQCEAW